jgi:hypothetical protein
MIGALLAIPNALAYAISKGRLRQLTARTRHGLEPRRRDRESGSDVVMKYAALREIGLARSCGAPYIVLGLFFAIVKLQILSHGSSGHGCGYP